MWVEPAIPARAVDEVFVVACGELTLAATFSPTRAMVPPTNTNVDLQGTTDCLVNGEEASGTLRATGHTLPDAKSFGCLFGVALIPGSFDSDYPGFAEVPGSVLIAFSVGVAVVTFASTQWLAAPAGAGAGVFAQTSPLPTACLSPDAVTWTGGFVFAGKSDELAES